MSFHHQQFGRAISVERVMQLGRNPVYIIGFRIQIFYMLRPALLKTLHPVFANKYNQHFAMFGVVLQFVAPVDSRLEVSFVAK